MLKGYSHSLLKTSRCCVCVRRLAHSKHHLMHYSITAEHSAQERPCTIRPFRGAGILGQYNIQEVKVGIR